MKTVRPKYVSKPDDENEPMAEPAAGFEQEEKTSPGVRPRATRVPRDDSRPIVVVGSQNGRRRGRIVDILRRDGWNGIEAHGPEEVLEMVLTLAPQVVMIDGDFRNQVGVPLPEAIRQHRPDAALRSVALLEPGAEGLAERIAVALSDAYDDFVADSDNDVEVMSRATANLRVARSMAQLNLKRRDAALLLKLTQMLASSLDMQLILHTVSGLVAEVIAHERCSIVLVDPNDDDAMMVAASEDSGVRDLRIRLSSYPELKQCVETAAPVLIGNVSDDPLLSKVSHSLIDRGVSAMALFPIMFDEAVTGVLFLRSSRVKTRMSPLAIQFGQTVAAACAVAIRNARIFDNFRDQNVHIESMRVQAERHNVTLKRYQDFFEYAADGIAVIDVEGRIHYANKEGRRLLGRTRDDLKDLHFQALLAEESARLWPEVVAQVRHGRFKRSFDVFVAAASEERIFSLSAGGVGPGTGLLILSFRDVTEMREMEGELRTTKEFLENLIDNSVDAIVAADMNGNIMLFNKGAELVYGYSAKDTIGVMHVRRLYPDGGANEVMRRLRDARWGGPGRLSPERREILNAEGIAVPVSMSASIIYEDGEEVATVGVFADLRDRMNIERQLNEAREQLTKAEKSRVAAELAGMAAHELNQPLTSVLGYAEMLLARIPQSDPSWRPVDTIFRQAERMAGIVRKIGRIATYETKPYGGNTAIIDLKMAVADNEAPSLDPSVVVAGNESVEVESASVPRPGHGRVANSAHPQLISSGSDGDDEITVPPRASGLMVALAGQRVKAAATNADRAAVVRPDTVDVEPTGYAQRLAQPAVDPEVPRPSLSVNKLSRPMPRSLMLESQAPPAGENDEHTSPAIKFSDLRRRTSALASDKKPATTTATTNADDTNKNNNNK